MPPNEKCPGCGEIVPDWHREWHTRSDQAKIFQGIAGMECPLCGAVVIHAQWFTPLTPTPADSPVARVARDAIQAAYWASVNAGGTLEMYLQTIEGMPFAQHWDADAVRRADQFVVDNPL